MKSSNAREMVTSLLRPQLSSNSRHGRFECMRSHSSVISVGTTQTSRLRDFVTPTRKSYTRSPLKCLKAANVSVLVATRGITATIRKSPVACALSARWPRTASPHHGIRAGGFSILKAPQVKCGAST